VPVPPLTDARVVGLPTYGTAADVRRALEVLSSTREVGVDHPADELVELDGR
jgi:hypothetical protein